MKIGRWIITREHPAERALRKWGELSPELRELIARGVRAIAKDQIQEILESQDIPWNSGHVEDDWEPTPLIETARHRLGVPAGTPYTSDIQRELDQELFPE